MFASLTSCPSELFSTELKKSGAAILMPMDRDGSDRFEEDGVD